MNATLTRVGSRGVLRGVEPVEERIRPQLSGRSVTHSCTGTGSQTYFASSPYRAVFTSAEVLMVEATR